jgi:hypothetical protein
MATIPTYEGGMVVGGLAAPKQQGLNIGAFTNPMGELAGQAVKA